MAFPNIQRAAARHEALQRANNSSHPGEFVPEPEAITRERLWTDRQPPARLEVKPIPISRRREQFAHVRARNCELAGNLGKRNRAGCAARPMQKNSEYQKFFLTPDPNHPYIRCHPVPLEGRSRSSQTRGGLRWTRTVLKTRAPEADGEVVWS